MSREYNFYLELHKSNVEQGFRWMQKHLPHRLSDDILEEFRAMGIDLEHQICFAHDMSKTEPDEYSAYDRYFYGGNRSYQVVEEFNHAWLKHIHRNPHHWQHWVIVGEKILDMPYNYIIEMICDWWSFSWKEGNLYEIFNWYDKHEEHMKLSDHTRIIVEAILSEIRYKLIEMKEECCCD